MIGRIALLAAAAVACTVAAAGPSVAAAAPIYAAAWLTNDSHALLSSAFSHPTLPCPLIRSDTIVDAASFPIALPAVLPLSALSNGMWGQAQRIQLLAFVRDERVQSMLLSQSLPPNASSTISLQRSQHSYPAVVLAHTNSSSASSQFEVQGRLMDADSYAEALWARLESAGIIAIGRSDGSAALQTLGSIVNVTLTAADAGATGSSFTTLLPATRFFPATTATIQILDPTQPQNNLDAFTCVASSVAPDGLSCLGSGSTADASELVRGFFLPPSASTLRSQIVNPCIHEFDVVPFSDHTTLEFMPADPSVYYPYLQAVQNYTVLAYARDEHVSAVLLALTGPLGSDSDGHSNAVYSLNSYSHTTVTAMAPGGIYGAAYSNVLWTRIVNASILVVTRDAAGHITGAEFGPGLPLTASWDATLPAFDDTQTLFTLYPPTNVHVSLITPGSLSLQAIVCLSDVWNAGARRCDAEPTPWPAPENEPPHHEPLARWLKILLGVVGGLAVALCMLCGCSFCYRRAHAGYKGPLDEQMRGEAPHAQAETYRPPQYRPVNE